MKRFTMTAPAQSPGLNRRGFLKVATLGSAGFLIGCSPAESPEVSSTVAAKKSVSQSPLSLNAFVKVASDNTVTVVVKHLDKGQGVTTGLSAIVAEELDADWAQMRNEFAPSDPTVYNNLFFGPIQGTGGSTAIANSWMQLRQASAGARHMLVEAAASEWGVERSSVTVLKGIVSSGSHSATFGELAVKAATLAPPEDPILKNPDQFTLLGTHLPRVDSNAKTDGTLKFTMDLTRPNQQIAVVARAPRFGATVSSFDATAAKAIDGVLDVVQIPRGVAVLASSYYSASKGRDALNITWDNSAAEMRSSDAIQRDFEALLVEDGIVARSEVDAQGSIAKADSTFETKFSFPYLAHATMEPLDCLVELGSDLCTIWTGSQIPTLDQGAAAAITGLRPDQVVIHTQYAGGSFGRRAVPDSDFVAEAVTIAKAIDGKVPVKLIWSREDDMTGGRYRPMAVHRLRGALDAEGNIAAWDHRIVSESILTGTPFEGMIVDGIDTSIVEGANNLPYAIDNIRVDMHAAETGVPVLWWRSVGHTHTAYATEVFFDQLARKANKDPFELRRSLLQKHPRHLAVLEKAASEAGWGTSMPAGHGRGIAVHESFNSFVAEVAEVKVSESGELEVIRVVCAVDCGFAVTPDVVKAQMEGGIGYGLSAALREAITLTDGVVDQTNFDRYRPLRINEMPDIEVHIVNSGEAPTGVGEPGTPPVAPAVANAIADATGRVIVDLPIADQLRRG